MFDALVTTSDDPFELADTLAALVPAVVQGALRKVTVIAERQPSHATLRLIEESGADLRIIPGDVPARWQAALQQKEQGWTLCLAAGIVPAGEWLDALIRFMARAQPGDGAQFRVGGSWTARMAVRLRRMAGLRVIAAGYFAISAMPLQRMIVLPALVEDRRAGAGGIFPIFAD